MARTPAISVRLRDRQLGKFMAVAGIRSNLALAARMGNVVSESTISRARNGHPPNAELIGGLLRAFPDLSFEDLFEIADTVEPETDAA